MKKSFLIIIAAILILIFGFYTLNNSKTTRTGDSIGSNLEKITIKVNIPCSGHASLIQSYLMQAGVSDVKFRTPNLFDIYYDPSKISKEQIMNINIFQEYPAKIMN